MQLWRSFITKRFHLSESPLGKGALAFRNEHASRELLMVNRAVGLFILLAIIFLTVPLVGHSASSKTPNRFITNAKFESNPTLKVGSYELTMADEKITIKRANSIIYTHLFQKGSKPAYCFYGQNSNYLLIKETKTAAVEVYFDLWLVNLAQKNPAKISLQSNHFPIKAMPQLFVLLSPDNGRTVFSYFGINLKNSKSSKILDLKINSSLTGTVICKAEPLIPAGPVFAETTSTGARIRMSNNKSSDGTDLLIEPSPNILDFGQVAVGDSLEKQFTLKNNGATPLTYTITFFDPSITPTPTPNPAPVFIVSPTGGDIPGSTGVPINVKFAPLSTGYFSEDLYVNYYDPNINQNQTLKEVWIFGTGVTPTPSPTPPSTPTPNTPTPTQATPTPTQATPTPTENTPTPTENTPTPTQATPTPTIPTSYLAIPGKLYAFVSFPSNVFPPRTEPDWVRIGSFFTANAEINQMSVSQFRVNFEETVEQNQCSYLSVTQTGVSQSNVTPNSAIVSSSFSATVKYKKRVTPTTFKTVTLIKTGQLVIHLNKVGSQWLIDNARLSIDP
ncbi:MAG TPA: hypothetical protein VHY08_05955 [Bacillota bacterium]|nr:hypothetical protein [Bacillota bacterium]